MGEDGSSQVAVFASVKELEVVMLRMLGLVRMQFIVPRAARFTCVGAGVTRLLLREVLELA